MSQWTPANRRAPNTLIHEVEQLWTSAAYALAEGDVDNYTLQYVYDMAKLYTDNRTEFYSYRTQFVIFFQNYISDPINYARLAVIVADRLNRGDALPFEIRRPLGFDQFFVTFFYIFLFNKKQILFNNIFNFFYIFIINFTSFKITVFIFTGDCCCSTSQKSI